MVLDPRGSLNFCSYARILRIRQKVYSRAIRIVTIVFSQISLMLYAVSHLLLTLVLLYFTLGEGETGNYLRAHPWCPVKAAD